jgi:hypothetical protein
MHLLCSELVRGCLPVCHEVVVHGATVVDYVRNQGSIVIIVFDTNDEGALPTIITLHFNGFPFVVRRGKAEECLRNVVGYLGQILTITVGCVQLFVNCVPAVERLLFASMDWSVGGGGRSQNS